MAEGIQRLDIVKLGRTAQELHTVTSHPHDGRVWIKQHTTGARRQVAVSRCIVVGHGDDYQHGTAYASKSERKA